MRVHFRLALLSAPILLLGCNDQPAPTAAPEAAVAAAAADDHATQAHSAILFRFNRLVGNPRPFIGANNPIRGINAGGLPWFIRQGEARLDAHGELLVRVQGLVIDPHDPEAQARGLAGVNPSPQFRAILSCLTVDAHGNVATVNLATAPVPATTGLGAGNAQIRERLTGIPHPCIAPIVFVTSPTGAWFAVSGF